MQRLSKVRVCFLSGIFSLGCISIFASVCGISVLYSFVKPATTILIIVMLVCFSKKPLSKPSILTFVSLVFCLMGDTLLLKESFFIYGLAAFLVAHLVFAYLFFTLVDDRYFLSTLTLLTLISISYYIFLLPNLGNLYLPVAIYMVCIVIMSWQGIRAGMNRTNNANNLLVIAPILFMISDAILAFNKFYLPFEWSALPILGTYWLSLTLIVVAMSEDSTKHQEQLTSW